MLHGPKSQSKERSDADRRAVAPDVNPREIHPRSNGADGVAGDRLKAKGIGQRVSRMQQAMGNQGMLRMLSRSTPRLQTKLTVNQPGDQFEQEADQVAEQVMRMPAPSMAPEATSAADDETRLQRKCACGGGCESCKEHEEEKLLQRKAVSAGAPPGAAPPIVHEVLRSSGQPLDRATRAFFEPRFGCDFSGVQVHTDRRAAESARAVNAHAYAVGSHLVFGAARYSPSTRGGAWLLAHELAHVVQQQSSPRHPPATLALDGEGGTSEHAADTAADSVLGNRHVPTLNGSAVAVQRLRITQTDRISDDERLIHYDDGSTRRVRRVRWTSQETGPANWAQATPDIDLQQVWLDIEWCAGENHGTVTVGADIPAQVINLIIRTVTSGGDINTALRGVNLTPFVQLNMLQSGRFQIAASGDVTVDLHGHVTGGGGSVGVSTGPVDLTIGAGSREVGGRPDVHVEGQVRWTPGRQTPREHCQDQRKHIVEHTRYDCSRQPPPGTPAPPTTPLPQYVPLFFNYANAVPVQPEYGNMLQNIVERVAQGYTVATIEGETSPEGPRDRPGLQPRAPGQFIDNNRLADSRANAARNDLRAALQQAIDRIAAGGDLIMRQEVLDSRRRRLQAALDSLPAAGRHAPAEMFGDRPTGEEIPENMMFPGLQEQIGTPSQPDILEQHHVTGADVAQEPRTEGETAAGEFRTAQHAGRARPLSQAERLQAIYPVFRRALVRVNPPPPPPPDLSLTRAVVAPVIGEAVPCTDADRALFTGATAGQEEQLLQRKAVSAGAPHGAPPIVHEVLRSPGQPLDPATRAFFEPRFGCDLSGVQVRTDAQAAESAHAVNALAYTVGSNVVFANGQYSPQSDAGRRLLAHELVHVVQQAHGLQAPRTQKNLKIGAPYAGRAAGSTMPAPLGKSLGSVAPSQVQRQQPQEKTTPTFRAVDDEKAQKEFERKVADYQKKGKTKPDAAFLAMDDMFAERVKEMGGRRLAGTATPGTAGTKTFLKVTDPVSVEGKMIDPNFYNAAIDDQSYNCHSFTFYEAKRSKLDKLKQLAHKIPKEGENLAGKDYFKAEELIQNGILFEPGAPMLVSPRWVLDDEATEQLKGYTAIPPGGQVAKGDIVVYSKAGELPHSGKVTEVNAKGQATKVKGKWGHYSLFEHPPEAVPAHYGTPTFYRKKTEQKKDQKKDQKLQRRAESTGAPHGAPPIVHEVIRSPGQPLDPVTRAFFEPRFGCDLSGVQVHTDGRAAESARAVNAFAYTVGRDMVFGSGQYSPSSRAGRQLLAHELAHVLQQSGGKASSFEPSMLSPSLAAQATPSAMLQRQAAAVQPPEAIEALDSMSATIFEGLWGDPPDDVGLLISGLSMLVTKFDQPDGPLTHAAVARSLLAVLKKLRIQEQLSPRDTDGALMREDWVATIDQADHTVPWTSSRPHDVAGLQNDIPGFDLSHEQDWILAADRGPQPAVSPTKATPRPRLSPADASKAGPQATPTIAAPAIPDKVVFENAPFNGALVVQLPGNKYAKVDSDRYAKTGNIGRATAWARYLFTVDSSVIAISITPQGDTIYYVARLDAAFTQSDLRPQTLKNDPTLLGAEGRILSDLPGSYGVLLVRLADDSFWAPTKSGLTASLDQVKQEQQQGKAGLSGETITSAGLTVDWRVQEIRKLIENHWTDDADEKNIIRIIAQTPTLQAADLVQRLSSDKTGDETLLEALDRVVDGENNQLLHEALSQLRMKGLGPQQSPKALTEAPVLPWHDVMGFFEDSATFSVTVTEKGKYRLSYNGGAGLLSSRDFQTEVQALRPNYFNLFVGGMDFEPNTTIIIHDYDTGRFVPVMVQELAGYRNAAVRKFLGDVGTIVSLALPVTPATSVVGKIAVYTFEKALPALILLVDENRLNIVEWWPNWGPKILKFVDIAKVAVAVYGVYRFAMSSAQFFKNWKQVRAMRKALDGAAINEDAERVARALESQSDELIEQAEKLRKAEPAGKVPAQDVVSDPAAEAQTATSPVAPAKPGPAVSKFDVLEGVTKDTRDFLNSPANQPLKNALQDNPLAAQVLKVCHSLCYPEFAQPEQIARLERILEDAQQRGWSINVRRLQQGLRDPSVTTVDDLNHVIEAVSQQFQKQAALAEEIAGAVGPGAAKITEFTPNQTTEVIKSKLDSIAQYRQTNGLPGFKAGDAKTGTVAVTTVNGNTYFGMNSTLNESLYSLSLEERRLWFNNLKSQGKLKDLKNLGDAQFLNHAESEALIKAYKDTSTTSMPEKIDIFVDRQTCPSCRDYYGELAGSLGVKEVHIYYLNQAQPPVIIKGR